MYMVYTSSSDKLTLLKFFGSEVFSSNECKMFNLKHFVRHHMLKSIQGKGILLILYLCKSIDSHIYSINIKGCAYKF